jgi:hypothetical protein
MLLSVPMIFAGAILILTAWRRKANTPAIHSDAINSDQGKT